MVISTPYYGLVLTSHFDYCSVEWGNCGKTLRDKLHRLQNCAPRVLTNSNYDADASILLNDLGWQNLETRRHIKKGVMVYKSLNCLAPHYMPSKFILRSDLFLITLEILKISLLLFFPCHEPITIEIASATAGLFCGTICPLLHKQNL